MPLILRSARSKIDLDDIWDRIAQHNVDAADKLVKQIDAALQLYAIFPKMGTDRSNYLPNVRSFPMGNYLVFYRIMSDGIQLMRVFHGMRNLPEFIRDELENTDSP